MANGRNKSLNFSECVVNLRQISGITKLKKYVEKHKKEFFHKNTHSTTESVG